MDPDVPVPVPAPDRERNVYIATLADSAERYEDVIRLMKEVARMHVELTTEERDLLSTAYHKLITTPRSSWKTLIAIEASHRMRGLMEFVPQIRELTAKVAEEIDGFCADARSLLIGHVLSHCTSPDNRVFFYTMLGDCYRYNAEVISEGLAERAELIHYGLNAYGEAVTIAENNLHAAHPTRLSLALNFAVFNHEILQAVGNASEIAQRARDEATPALLSTLDHPARLKSEQILTVLSAKLAVWTNNNVVNVAATLEGPELVD